MIVCQCAVVRAEEIRAEVRLGAETIDLVCTRSGAGAICGGCTPAVADIVGDELARARDATRARH